LHNFLVDGAKHRSALGIEHFHMNRIAELQQGRLDFARRQFFQHAPFLQASRTNRRFPVPVLSLASFISWLQGDL
jgi:hypothetical protein